MLTGALLRSHKSPTRKFHRFGKVIAATLTAAAIFVSPAHGLDDVLDSPAITSAKVAQSLLLDIALAGERLVAVGERGHIIYSDDNGLSWTQATVPASATLTAVYFTDANNGWAVGHDAIVVHTSDAGVTWEKQFDGFVANKKVVSQAKLDKVNTEAELQSAMRTHNSDAIAASETRLENVTFALEDAQFDLENGTTKPLLDLWFKNAKEGFVIGAYGFMFRTTDGGKNWSDWSGRIQNPDRFHLNAIAHAGFNNLVMVGEAGMIFRSRDGGLSWDAVKSPYEGSLFGLQSMNKGAVMLAYGLRGNIFRSTDQGRKWLRVNSGTKQTLIGATALSGSTLVMAGSAGVFVRGIDSGRSYQSKVLASRQANAAVVEAPDGNLILVGEGGIKLVASNGASINAQITVK